MKSALLKDIFREIGNTKSRFFSIFAIIALGAGFFAGLNITCPDMIVTQERYFSESNLMDIRLVSNYGFGENDVEAIKSMETVREVYSAYSKDVFIQSGENGSIVAKLMSYPDKGMNSVVLLEGRLPENPDECVVEKHSQLAVVHEIGDTVTVYTTDPDDPIEDSLERNSWTVVGIVMSPQYISYDRGTATIGNGSADTYVMVPEENFKYEVYTDIYVTMDSTEGISPFEDEYSAAIEIAKEDFENLGEERAPARAEEIKSEAREKLDDAKQEIADAEKELADAEAELSDAETKLSDAEKELANGWAEYYSGLAEYNDGKKKFGEEIARAEEELENGAIQIAEGWKQYEEGKKQLEEGRKQFEEGLASSGMSLESLSTMKTHLEYMIKSLEIVPENLRPETTNKLIAELNAQIAQIDATFAAYDQLIAGEQELASAYGDLLAAESQISYGKAELEQAKTDGEKELEDAYEEIQKGYAKLKDGEAELAEGRQEYEEGLTEFEEAKAEAEAEIAKAKREIADAEKDLEELAEPVWYVFTRDDNPGYSGYESDVYIIESVGKVFPIFFFLVAMLVCLTTMTRMVEEQRTQTGTLKALGYGKGAIMAKYIVYSSFASISGAVFGIALCVFVFPIIIYGAYAMRYIVPDLVFTAAPLVWLGVIAICVLCTTLAVIMACYAELRENPAELMRPKAPKAGKRVLLEKIPFIWNRLNFNGKVTVRNLFRYKKRIFMTILGIAGCAALTFTGFGIFSSVSGIIEKQYGELFKYDLIVAIDTDSEKEETEELYEELDSNGISETNLSAYVKAAKFGGFGNITLVVPSDTEAFEQMVTLRSRTTEEEYELSDDGIIITERFSDIAELYAGDELTFYCDDVRFTAKITAVTENYTAHFIYMSPKLYEKLSGEVFSENSVFTIMSDDGAEAQDKLANTLTGYESVLALSFSKTAMESFSSTVENLNYVIVLIIVCAAALAFVVLYNLTNINITERIREIATIKVLGFYDREVSEYVFRENIILSVMGAGAGLLLGKALHAFVLGAIQTDDIMFGREMPVWVYFAAFAMTVIFALLVNGIMFFRLKKISMVESLKSVE